VRYGAGYARGRYWQGALRLLLRLSFPASLPRFVFPDFLRFSFKLGHPLPPPIGFMGVRMRIMCNSSMLEDTRARAAGDIGCVPACVGLFCISSLLSLGFLACLLASFPRFFAWLLSFQACALVSWCVCACACS
jgi:hypothetical protein